MEGADRRKTGAHYTSEVNILKVLGPLFLDDLRAELDKLAGFQTTQQGRYAIAPLAANKARIQEFVRRLRRLNFFDPACGCGNFLVVAYRAIRALELDALRLLYVDQATLTGFDGAMMSQVNVDQFHGIEIGEFPAHIAQVSMWMADHLANNAFDAVFGTTLPRIPLKQSANIVHGDALETDWARVLPPEKCSFVMGNPPFIGAKFQSPEQRAQVRALAALGGSGGTLDYVAAWFIKAGAYVAANHRIRIGFVATNSICQGEQVAQLWPLLFDRYHLEIAFAHRSFVWDSEARGKAHVHVVIIGLAHRDAVPDTKRLFSYDDGKGEAEESTHGALTAYLFDAKSAAVRHLVVASEARPINGAQPLITGSKPIDGGYLIFDASERQQMIASEPVAAELLRPFIGAEEYINDGHRWILALQGDPLAEMHASPTIRARLAKVRDFRKGLIPRKKAKADEAAPVSGISSLALASTPAAFHVTVLPKKPFLVIPQVSSERRDYAPIGWLEPPTIPSDKLRLLNDATLWEFGVLTSAMHMAWMRTITGRMKSDYMYSVGVVYNTFPWPDATPAQRASIETLAQAVLDARAAHPAASLAQLYDPLTMPANLRSAHTALDRAVDRLYRREPFTGDRAAGDRERVEHLFTRYAALIDPLATAGVKANRRVARAAKAKAD